MNGVEVIAGGGCGMMGPSGENGQSGVGLAANYDSLVSKPQPHWMSLLCQR